MQLSCGYDVGPVWTLFPLCSCRRICHCSTSVVKIGGRMIIDRKYHHLDHFNEKCGPALVENQ